MTRITAFLSVTSKTLAPHEISDFLEIDADREVVKGSQRTPPRSRPKNNGWNIGCRFQEYVDLDFAIGELAKRLGEKVENLSRLRHHEYLNEISVKIAIAPEHGEVPLFFSRETIAFLSKIGASLDIEYFPE
ncbi:MAG: DUF4279 domain-containing protein [Mesorhizobium sp.]|uniref:DUF4279 domain-containing protein n=1 Tax=unclassified Mesorhizobium TaxID=325217 RepID=UPI000FE51A80|nr:MULTISPECIES: DUF4279 domain-containing protein [unclassified Mesorhizobium]RWB31265.1 MAG: DUF4279 domain-containing protein [Mesorhizobium sp.]RWB65462.1 MAG: DUF4279 domain-containing protein [Mesorhizobium sp.]RWC23853.1 MAG: DUF4279 domain-containing protein [Mesorhizobium sp.]RWD21390.1 MAG: DUF4279 domain-containing protein [Mesorhizobium sp.]TGT94438.1 DUF4279 domain-containing protein [Mesorhizobium sp. M5C.F.Ca.ET.164.01.1.1]